MTQIITHSSDTDKSNPTTPQPAKAPLNGALDGPTSPHDQPTRLDPPHDLTPSHDAVTASQEPLEVRTPSEPVPVKPSPPLQITPQPLPDDFRTFLLRLWRNGSFGYFWQASNLRYTQEEAEKKNAKSKSKSKKIRANTTNKVTLTSWIDLSGSLPAHLPAQSFRHPSQKLTYRTIRDRFIAPNDSPLLNSYFGVNPAVPTPTQRRKNRYGVRSRLDTVEVVNAMIGDLDVKEFESWEHLRAYVASLPLKPSATINTGGGLHLYWFLKDTYHIFIDGKSDKKRLAYIKDLWARWNEAHEFDKMAKDLIRVLRNAYSWNAKPKRGPDYPYVQFEHVDYSIEYDLADIERVISEVSPKQVPDKPKRTRTVKQPKTVKPASNWRAPQVESVPSFRSQEEKAVWYLQFFDSDDYHDWKITALALSGEPYGFEVWNEWSKKSHKYDDLTARSEWEQVLDERNTRLVSGQPVMGFGRLVVMARDRGCPDHKSLEADETILGELQKRSERAQERVNLSVMRVCVSDALSALFAPSGRYALLNPTGHKELYSHPKSKPLNYAILDHIIGGDRQVRIDGQRQWTKVCMVVNPTDEQGLTRVWALGASNETERDSIINTLLEHGLVSFSYMVSPVIRHFHDSNDPNTRILCQNDGFAIPYIYRATPISTNVTVGKMAKDPFWHTFLTQEMFDPVIQHIVLCCFSEPVPASLLRTLASHTHTHEQQIDPSVLAFNLPVIHPQFSPSDHQIILSKPDGQRTITLAARDMGIKKWYGILESGIYNNPQIVLDRCASILTSDIQPMRGRTHETGQSIESVIRWYNRQTVNLIMNECQHEQALVKWDGGDGYELGWSACCGITSAFNQLAFLREVGLRELAIILRDEHGLGHAGEWVIDEAPVIEDMGERIEEHKHSLKETRGDVEQVVNAIATDQAHKGVIYVLKMSAGGGKSYIVQKLIPYWRRDKGLLTYITTETKKLSYEWLESLQGRTSAFVFESVMDICTCFDSQFKALAMSKGYTLDHEEGCPFPAQMAELFRSENKRAKRSAILRHEHINIRAEGKRLVGGADIYIHDESIVKVLRPSKLVNLSFIRGLLTRMKNDRCEPLEMAFIEALLHVTDRRLAPYQYVMGDRLIKRMVEHLKSLNIELSEALEAFKKTGYAHKPRQKLTNADDIEKKPPIWVPDFLRAVDLTLANSIHPSFSLIQLAKEDEPSKLVIEYSIANEYLSELNTPIGTTSHLVLDATANELIYKALLPSWPVKMEVHAIPPSPQHRFIWIRGLNLTRRNLRNNFGAISNKIAAICNEQGLLIDGCITRKDVRERATRTFGLDESRVLHYRNQRGSNALRDLDTVLMLADPTVPVGAAIRQAHAIWCHDEEPFETFPDGNLTQRVAGGFHVAKDKRVQAVLDMVLDESNQSGHRLRTVLSEGSKTLIYCGYQHPSDFIEGLDRERVTIIDVTDLHGNRVLGAIDIYLDKVEARRKAATPMVEQPKATENDQKRPKKTDFELPKPTQAPEKIEIMPPGGTQTEESEHDVYRLCIATKNAKTELDAFALLDQAQEVNERLKGMEYDKLKAMIGEYRERVKAEFIKRSKKKRKRGRKR